MVIDVQRGQFTITSVSGIIAPRPPKLDMHIRVQVVEGDGTAGDSLQLVILATPGSAGAATIAKRLQEASVRIAALTSVEPVAIQLRDIVGIAEAS